MWKLRKWWYCPSESIIITKIFITKNISVQGQNKKKPHLQENEQGIVKIENCFLESENRQCYLSSSFPKYLNNDFYWALLLDNLSCKVVAQTDLMKYLELTKTSCLEEAPMKPSAARNTFKTCWLLGRLYDVSQTHRFVNCYPSWVDSLSNFNTW